MPISDEEMIEAKMKVIKDEFDKRSTLDEQFNFILLLMASQAVLIDGAAAQLQNRILALRMCLPKADVDRAERAIEQADAEGRS